jgi:hypothetical protein
MSPTANCGYFAFNIVSSAVVFNPRLTAPEVVVAVTGLVAETLVRVPGKVWPGAKLKMPLLLIEKAGYLLDEPYLKM